MSNHAHSASPAWPSRVRFALRRLGLDVPFGGTLAPVELENALSGIAPAKRDYYRHEMMRAGIRKKGKSNESF